MAADNRAAEFDEPVAVALSEVTPNFNTKTNDDISSSTALQIPRIQITEHELMNADEDEKERRQREDNVVATSGVSTDPSVVVISPRPQSALERPLRRKMFCLAINSAFSVGRLAERLGAKEASFKAVRRAFSLTMGGVRMEKVRGVSSAAKTVGGNNKKFSIQAYWPLPKQQTNNGENNNNSDLVKRSVVVYLRGNIPVSSARAYHSFLANLCLDVDAIVLSLNYTEANSLFAILDDCIAFTLSLLAGDFDADFSEAFAVDNEKIVLAGDGVGATMACAVALELARRTTNADLPSIHGLLLVCPPLQALGTNLFVSHQRFSNINCASVSHRLDICLPPYADIRDRSNVKLAKAAIRLEKHVPLELKNRLLRRIFPRFEAPPTTSPSEQVPGITVELTRLAVCSRLWPLLMKNKELSLLPMTMLQACDHDTLFDEQRIFAKRMSRVCGYRFRFSVVLNATHNDSIFYKFFKTQSALNGYREIVDFLKDTIAKPPMHDSLLPSVPVVNCLPECLE